MEWIVIKVIWVKKKKKKEEEKKEKKVISKSWGYFIHL